MNGQMQGKIPQIRFKERILKSITKNKQTNKKVNSSGINNDIDGINSNNNSHKINIYNIIIFVILMTLIDNISITNIITL